MSGAHHSMFEFPDVSCLLWKQFLYLSVIISPLWRARAGCTSMERPEISPEPKRRDFIKKSCAVIIGAVTALVPAISGLLVLLDPLRRKAQDNDAVLIASLSSLPVDGVPRKFPVVADHTDAWNRVPRVPIGAVYLRRIGDKQIQAFNVICPHAGCFVDYDLSRKGYHCPCHNSSFGVDGTIADPKSPSPRGLDELEVEIRSGNEIWVKFQNFRAGGKEKIPV
jgi:menaquinol-cytochrome c reductase iron-sulfur subunit